MKYSRSGSPNDGPWTNLIWPAAKKMYFLSYFFFDVELNGVFIRFYFILFLDSAQRDEYIDFSVICFVLCLCA